LRILAFTAVTYTVIRFMKALQRLKMFFPYKVWMKSP
jgi:hypothetical protein